MSEIPFPNTLPNEPIPIKSIWLLFLRLQAAMRDYSFTLIPLLWFLMILLPIFNNVWLGIGFGTLLVTSIHTLLEGLKKTSIGMSLNGLILQPPPSWFWPRLLVRNLVKGLTLVSPLVLGLIFIGGEPFDNIVLQGLSFFTLLLLLYNGIGMAQGREPLHNQISGFKVIQDIGKPVQYVRLYSSMAVYALFLLLVIFTTLSTFLGNCGRPKSSMVRGNMYQLQGMVEAYAVDWGGRYPPSVQVLEQEAKKENKHYWQDLENPFSGYKTKSEKSLINAASPPSEGVVSYEPIGPHFTRYFIYGYEKKGKRVQDKGRDFFLTNS